MSTDPDSPAHTPTVADRLLAAGISQGAIDAHFAAGVLRVDGEPVTDLAQPAPKPARVVIHGT